MYSIKPIDKKAVISAVKTGNVLVAQDYNIYDGPGLMVAVIIAEAGVTTNFKAAGLNDSFATMAHAGFLYHILKWMHTG